MARHNQFVNIVKNVIETYASQNNPVKPFEIKKYIDKLYPDDTCERKTIGRALERLREDYGVLDNGEWKNPTQLLRYTIHTRDSADIITDYYFEYREEDDDKLTDGEIMFLMDAVQFSRHISKKTADTMMKKLLDIAGKNFGKNVPSYKKIDDNYRPVSADFFRFLEDINEALRNEKKISFYNTEYNANLKRVRAGSRTLVVNPISVVCFDGNYYLIYRETGSLAIKNCRVDMIGGVKMLDEDSDVDDMEVRNVRKHPEEYIVEHLYMSSGEPVEAVLQIDRNILSDLVDSFGNKIGIDEADEGSNNLTVHIRSSEKGIIDWALKFGEYAEVIEPYYLRGLISDRCYQISSSYSSSVSEIEYRERIAMALRHNRLSLFNINLNERESHRELNEVRYASFHNNKISDFSFLTRYDNLCELSISNNRISDPEVLSELGALRWLTLKNTGITDLDFLRSLERISRLTIKEISLENVDALYELPKLRYLNVNKPVARLIDKNRLKTVYGDSLTYTVGDGVGLIPSRSLNLPGKENHLLKRYSEPLEEISVFAVTDTDVRARLSNLMCAGLRPRGKKFSLIEGSCDAEERVKLYENFDEFTSSEYSWYVSYDGQTPKEAVSIDEEHIYAISIYKKDHGLKLVAMFRCDTRDFDDEKYLKAHIGLMAQIRYMVDNKIGWAEVSGEAERLFCRACTIDEVVDPSAIKKIYKDVKIDEDDYHYSRREAGGKKSVRRIAYGHIAD